LYILDEHAFEGDLILGRDFLQKEKLILVYSPLEQSPDEKVNLFTQLSLCIVEEDSNDSIEEIIREITSKCEPRASERLQNMLRNVRLEKHTSATDDYAVRVELKDTSVFRFAPRRSRGKTANTGYYYR